MLTMLGVVRYRKNPLRQVALLLVFVIFVSVQ